MRFTIISKSGAAMLIGIIAAPLLSSNPLAATQASYYVASTDNDGNPGSLSQPFLTITGARNVVGTANGVRASMASKTVTSQAASGTFTIAGTEPWAAESPRASREQSV